MCVGFWLLVNSAFGYLRNTILILSTQLILILIEVKLVTGIIIIIIIIINDGIYNLQRNESCSSMLCKVVTEFE